ncbi:polyphenol oxidase, partial [Trifolium medium]|nr:polyphenol oxidase [Trifolium medium]
MQIPSIFTNPNSSLYDPYRDPRHQPPATIDLEYDRAQGDLPNYIPRCAEEQIKLNLYTMHRTMYRNGNTNTLFHGGPFRGGDIPPDSKEDQSKSSGSIERSPHNIVHVWCGDPNQLDRKDMGHFYSSGRDPLFYALHGNVDRMWSIWKTLGGKRRDPTDRDWLESAFVFYDENKNLVKVKV